MKYLLNIQPLTIVTLKLLLRTVSQDEYSWKLIKMIFLHVSSSQIKSLFSVFISFLRSAVAQKNSSFLIFSLPSSTRHDAALSCLHLSFVTCFSSNWKDLIISAASVWCTWKQSISGLQIEGEVRSSINTNCSSVLFFGHEQKAKGRVSQEKRLICGFNPWLDSLIAVFSAGWGRDLMTGRQWACLIKEQQWTETGSGAAGLLSEESNKD